MIDAKSQETVSAPTLERRDDMGRLVAVTWYGVGAGGDAATARWLVAVDGSDCSLRAVAMVADLAARECGAEIDVVNVQPWLNKEAAEIELTRRGMEVTERARQLLDAAGVRWRLHVVMGEGAPEIVGMANALGSRGIGVGSHGLTATQSVLLGSVTDKVAHQANVPVLIVR